MLTKEQDRVLLRNSAIFAAVITAILVIPPWLFWNAFADGFTVVVATVYSFVGSAIAAYFSPVANRV